MTTTYKTYKWFNPRPCTLDEGAKMYRELASKHHPDHGGNTSDMQEINAEWEELKPTLPRFCSEQAKQGRQQSSSSRRTWIEIGGAVGLLRGIPQVVLLAEDVD